MLESALLGVSVAVDDNAVVSLVDEVRAAADVIQVGRLAAPALQLAGVRHKPDVHVIVLGEALDLGQHLAHILRLCHVQRPLMVQLIVRIDDQPPDAIPAEVRQPEKAANCQLNMSTTFSNVLYAEPGRL